MKCAISQSNYLPWKGYFDLIASVDHFVLYDSVQYTSRDWRSRNKIKTKSGSQWLAIPVSAPHRQTAINEAITADSKWRSRHWNTIVHNYARTKHFDLFREYFQDFYLRNDEIYLSKINEELIRSICGFLGIKTKISRDTEFNLEGDKITRLVNICQQLKADVYHSGPAAKDYMSADQFEEFGIKVEWFDYSGYPEYSQRFPPFEHAVSIIDLLFNEGPDASKFMKFSTFTQS